MKGITFNRSLWARFRGHPGHFQAVHSNAMLPLQELDRLSYTPILGDEIEFGGKRWFLDILTGKVTVADMECGISMSRTLGNADALFMERGCLQVASLRVRVNPLGFGYVGQGLI